MQQVIKMKNKHTETNIENNSEIAEINNKDEEITHLEKHQVLNTKKS